MEFENELASLTKLLGFFLPKIEGYQIETNIPGDKKWDIKTTIVVDIVDGVVQLITYRGIYPSWNGGLVMAIKYAMARLCHDYRDQIPEDSIYRDFGRRNEEGEAVWIEDGDKTRMQKHVEDLEAYATGMEALMQWFMLQSEEARATAHHQAYEITTLNAQMDTLNAQLDALKAQIEMFKDNDTRLTMQLAEKDAQLTLKDAQLTLKDAQLAELQAQVNPPQPSSESDEDEDDGGDDGDADAIEGAAQAEGAGGGILEEEEEEDPEERVMCVTTDEDTSDDEYTPKSANKRKRQN